MKRINFILILTFCTQYLFSQFLPPVSISNNAENLQYPGSLLSEDIDNDGDADVVMLSDFLGDVVWYENLDGNASMDQPCLLYTSPSPRDQRGSRMPSSA